MKPIACLAALLSLSFVACDPAGHLRVAVVRDGAGPIREPYPDASAWLECPIGGRTKLNPMRASGQFFAALIPAVDLDCVVAIETPDGAAARYRVRDICVDEPLREGYGCSNAFLYVAAPPT